MKRLYLLYLESNRPYKSSFEVDNYYKYLSIQCDSTIRNIARLYPYDVMDEMEADEKTLRGSSQEIAGCMMKELQEKVKEAGLEIIEVRITHLSYSEEIAAAMVSNLLVILCGNKEAQPIVNSGSIY